jgi:hypothetical protein
MTNRISSVRAAASFVNRAGLALVFASDAVVLPSLWEGVVGSGETTVFVVDETGRRVLSPELDRVWSLHVELSARCLACVGKHIGNRLALVSLDMLPALYALTGRAGDPDDFREAASLSPLERDLAGALLKHGTRTGPQLRRLLGLRNAKRTKQALESLQRQLVITRAGESPQPQGWDAALFDLIARRYRDRLRRPPDPADAMTTLARAVLRSAAEVSASDLARVLGCRKADAATALDRLVEERRAQRHEGRFPYWSSPPGAD